VPAPLGFAVIFPRLTGGALSPILAVVGVIGALLAWGFGAPFAAAGFALAGALALVAVRRIIAAHGDFAGAFGPAWEQSIAAERRTAMLRSSWLWRAPTPPDARWQRDVPFWTIPETGRTLLCDIWQPPTGVKPSGLAYIYCHGSAWYVLDKDAYTRRLFRHLAGQGHLVMDVAYRLYPEADVPGMIGDVKRAVAWLKGHAAEYAVSADRIVIGGSSAGGQMVQVAGFAPDHPELTPADVRGRDLTVRGIISCYGPSDMAVCFRHTNQHKIPGVGVTPPDLKLLGSSAPPLLVKLFGPGVSRLGYHKMPVAGRLDWLMGGTPAQVPEHYALCSGINHVHAGCPPTLLIQGEDDLITSAAATRELYAKLRAAGVPAVNLIFPHTDHGFDLTMLRYSPSAQGALFAMERFLALLAAEQPGVLVEREAM
jgi:acetyl esterase/lipase